MGLKDRTYLCSTLLILLMIIVISAGQSFHKITQYHEETEEDRRIKIKWCTVNRPEQHKCINFAMANERDRIRVGYDYFKVECLQAVSKSECMSLLDQEKATLTTLDAGEVFIGGRYSSLVPIAQELLEGGFKHYYAVAVVRKGKLSDVNSLRDLKGKKACFAGVETFAGWVVPIYTLMNQSAMEIIDCNNHVKSATQFFGPSCAVNCLTDKFNPIGDNSNKLCQLCIGKIPGGRCTDADPYAGYEGAFRCLAEGGEIAFLKHNTAPELLSSKEFYGLNADDFELLCTDGSRRRVSDYLACNWGKVPSDAVVTTSASSFELRKKYQLFLDKAAKLYHKGLIKNNTDQLDNNNNDNRNQNRDFDQFGNRLNNDNYNSNRFKRQNFGTFGGSQQNQDDNNNNNRYDPNNPQDRNRQDANNPYGPDHDQYGNRYDPNRPYDSNDRDNLNPYENRQSGNPNRDPYGNYPHVDPYNVNQYDQFGVNIDPYQDGSYDRNRKPTYGKNTPSSDYDPYFYNYTNQFNQSFYEVFSLFESSPRYGYKTNLLFQDASSSIVPLNENQQTYNTFLGEAEKVIMGVRRCEVNTMTLCVTSDVELDKCVKMRTALKAQLLKPEMNCYKAHSHITCMQAIQTKAADVAVLDASDIYTAGLNYELVPFMSEMYNLPEPEYYVVAVGKESDPSTELTYLKGKNTCHGGINTAAGWVYPLAFLLSNGWMRPYGCNSIRAAAEYFSKSCVPGALSTEYNSGVPYDNMCDLCHGSSYRYCRRDASEDYYGHTGAFRCLVEGGGHVAFVKHTTVTENTGGKREEWWARDNLNDDFELLCPDGTRAEINEFEKCNLGKVKANALVTRGGYYGYNETEISAYTKLFLYAQTFYGRKTTDEFSFSMFSSMPPYTDLIFQDATTQLKVIDRRKRYYAAYLGSDFMRARRVVDCHAGSNIISASMFTLIISNVVILFNRYY